MLPHLVLGQLVASVVLDVALSAGVRLGTIVATLVIVLVSNCGKFFATQRALIRFHSSVGSLVYIQVALLAESLITVVALMKSWRRLEILIIISSSSSRQVKGKVFMGCESLFAKDDLTRIFAYDTKICCENFDQTALCLLELHQDI